MNKHYSLVGRVAGGSIALSSNDFVIDFPEFSHSFEEVKTISTVIKFAQL